MYHNLSRLINVFFHLKVNVPASIAFKNGAFFFNLNCKVKLRPFVLRCSSLGSSMPMSPSADKWWRSSHTSSSSCSFSHSWTLLSTLFLQHLEELYVDRMDPPPPFEQPALEFVIVNHLRWQLDGVDAPDRHQGQLARQVRFCWVCGVFVCLSLRNLSSAWSQWFQKDNRCLTLYAESWASFSQLNHGEVVFEMLVLFSTLFSGTLFAFRRQCWRTMSLFFKKKKRPAILSGNHPSIHIL